MPASSPLEWERQGYRISTDPNLLDRDSIHAFLRESYWSPNLPRDVFDHSLQHSLVFGLYDEAGSQAGFARVVTDRAVFAYLADVFVFEEHRGRGLGVWLVETVLSHPDLQGMRRIVLGTKDAHELYSRFDFKPADSEVLMTRDRPATELYS
jgi:GNAT superfamily N-acetyltransferase